MMQHVDPGNDAVLTECKAANTMVACRAERPRAIAALHDSGILRVIITIHQFVLTKATRAVAPNFLVIKR